ncbi:MAG TPA: YXWGXW repeat-containing protein, partial [Kofleriaceae bacterium]
KTSKASKASKVGASSSSPTSVDAAAVAAAQSATMKTVALEQVTSIPTSCTARVEIINMTHTAEGDYIAVEGRLVLDIWSEVPNDYDGMIFVVEQHTVPADMTVDRWKAYVEAERAWRVRYHAFLDGEVEQGRIKVVDSKVTAPPPPPPRDEAKPPKPSKNARWIPGYWLYAETKFHWITGLWEVPQADIEQELTVVAPKPPPPAPPPTVAVEVPPAPAPAAAVDVGAHANVDANANVHGTATVTVVVEKPVEPPPTPTAVWTPGYWQWDGRAYIWIQGAWRIPPSPQQSTWAPASWSVTKRGAVFVPGRWSSGGSSGTPRVRDHRRR